MKPRTGLSLLELLIALGLLATALLPMMLAITPSLRLTQEEERLTVIANAARGTLQRVTAQTYPTLANYVTNQVNLAALLGATAAAEEMVVLNGVSRTPVVSIAPVGVGTVGLLEVSVRLDELRFSTLKSAW